MEPEQDQIVPTILLREKKESKPELREKAIITKAPDRKSVETPDESFTVNFVTETPNAKHSFPVTHQDLIAEDDLSSPGSSDDEGDPKRESFTAPGYDRLNKKNFDDFGDDVKDLQSQMKANEKEWGGDRQSLNESLKSSRDSRVQEEGGDRRSLNESLRSKDSGHDEVVKLDSDKRDSKSVGSKSEGDSRKEPPRPLSGKINIFEKQDNNTSVLKMARGPPSVAAPGPKQEEEKPMTQSGKLSDRLKMFGGGANFTRGLPTRIAEKKPEEIAGKEELKEAPKPEPSGPRTAEQNEDSPDSGTTITPLKPSDSSSIPPQQRTSISSPRKRSSSYVSMSAFETIEEEGSSGVESVESLDKVTPLPKIEPSSSRRQSAELLRLDGIVKTDTPSVSLATARKASSGSPSHSPLLSARKAAQSVKGTSADTSPAPVRAKFTSTPSTTSQGSEAMAMYMNSAYLPHLNSLQEKYEEEERKRVAKVMRGLLSLPRWTGASVQLKFMGLKTDDRPKLQIWKQHVSSFTL
jgi:hypothetical protein